MSQDKTAAFRKLKQLEVKAAKEVRVWQWLYDHSRGYVGQQGLAYARRRSASIATARERALIENPQYRQ